MFKKTHLHIYTWLHLFYAYIHVHPFMHIHTNSHVHKPKEKNSQAIECLFSRLLCHLLLCARLINISCPIFNIILSPNRISFEMLLKVNSLLTMAWRKSLFSSLKKKRLHMVCCHSSMNSSYLMENQRYFTLIQWAGRGEGRNGKLDTCVPCASKMEEEYTFLLWVPWLLPSLHLSYNGKWQVYVNDPHKDFALVKQSSYSGLSNYFMPCGSVIGAKMTILEKYIVIDSPLSPWNSLRPGLC